MKIDKISDLIKRVAKDEILPRFRNLREEEVMYKEPGEFVTAADLSSEQALFEGIKELYPQAVVTGEEDIAQNSSRLCDLLKAECGFLVDPIDGTNNFIKGNEKFAVMAVALIRGEVVASWIYLPMSDTLAVAEKGAGSSLNEVPITIKPAPDRLEDMIGAAHTNRMPETIKAHARENLKKIKKNDPAFCAGYDYVALVKSEKHFSAYHRALLWDHLPGTLLYSEAGGYTLGLDGRPYAPDSKGFGILSSPDEDAWHKIKDAIFQ